MFMFGPHDFRVSAEENRGSSGVDGRRRGYMLSRAYSWGFKGSLGVLLKQSSCFLGFFLPAVTVSSSFSEGDG